MCLTFSDAGDFCVFDESEKVNVAVVLYIRYVQNILYGNNSVDTSTSERPVLRTCITENEFTTKGFRIRVGLYISFH